MKKSLLLLSLLTISNLFSQSKYIDFKCEIYVKTEECRYCHEKHVHKRIPFSAIKTVNKNDDKYSVAISSLMEEKTSILSIFYPINSEMTKLCDQSYSRNHGVEVTVTKEYITDKLERSIVIEAQKKIDESNKQIDKANLEKKAEREKEEKEQKAAKEKLINERKPMQRALDSITYGFNLSKTKNNKSIGIIKRNIDFLTDSLNLNNIDEVYKNTSGEDWYLLMQFKLLYLAEINIGDFSQCIKDIAIIENFFNTMTKTKIDNQILEIKGWAYLLNGKHKEALIILKDAKNKANDPCVIAENLDYAIKNYRTIFPENKNITQSKTEEILIDLMCPKY